MRLKRDEIVGEITSLYGRSWHGYGQPTRYIGKDSRRIPGVSFDWLDETLSAAFKEQWGILPWTKIIANNLASWARRGEAKLTSKRLVEVHQALVDWWHATGFLSQPSEVKPAVGGFYGSVGRVVTYGVQHKVIWLNLMGKGRLPLLDKKSLTEEKELARRTYLPYMTTVSTVAHEAAHTEFATFTEPFSLAPQHPGSAAVSNLNQLLFSKLATENAYKLALNETFADTYGAMLALKAWDFAPEAIQELQTKADIRDANAKSWTKQSVKVLQRPVSAGEAGNGGHIDVYGATGSGIRAALASIDSWKELAGPALVGLAKNLAGACWFERFVAHPSRYGMTPALGHIIHGGESYLAANPMAFFSMPLARECLEETLYRGYDGAMALLEREKDTPGLAPYIEFWKQRYSPEEWDKWGSEFFKDPAFNKARYSSDNAAIDMALHNEALGRVGQVFAELHVTSLGRWMAASPIDRPAVFEANRQEIMEVLRAETPEGETVAERSPISLAGQDQQGSLDLFALGWVPR